MNDNVDPDRLPSCKRGVHIAHLNLQSLRNKLDVVKAHITVCNFDIFTFSESWLDERYSNSMLQIKGYNLIRLDRAWSDTAQLTPKRGGGVGMYIKNTYSYITNTYEEYNRSCGYIECLWTEIVRPNARNMIICSLYRPPNGSATSFCDELTNSINDINANNNKEIYILGDFNINYSVKTSDDMRPLHDFELFTNLKQLITKPTRQNNTIDLIFTNSLSISTCGVLDLGISDHELIYCSIKKAKTRFNRVEYTGRNYNTYDTNALCDYLIGYDWSYFTNILDPSECWDELIRVICTKLDEMCPLKKKYVRDRNEPWLTNEIIDQIHHKNLAWKKAKKTKNIDDVNHAKVLRNEVKTTIRRAKATFVQDYLQDEDISTKKFWEKIKYIMPSKCYQSTINLVDQETKTPVNSTEVPNFINEFFVGIGPKLALNFGTEWIDEINTVVDIEMESVIVTEESLRKLIIEINVSKSSAIDNISSRVLKDAFLVLIPQLLHMYNQCFRLNIFPDLWKLANVIPLQKPGDPTDVNNLRPISLLPLPGKILEKLLHAKISAHLENNNLLISEQGGFRKGKSTIHTIANFTDDIMLQLNSNNYTIAAFVDFKKAFDTVDHGILLKKLSHYGIGLDTMALITNYLTGRKQRCTTNGITSQELCIECGVPQGSIMGPLLFLLYINDLHTAFDCCKYYLYADDTVLYMSDTDEEIAHAGLQHDLHGLNRWCSLNKITINTKKTKSMLFGTNNRLKKAKKLDLKIGGDSIHYVKNFNYLGVKLDCKLTFESHALESMRLVSHKIYMLSQIRNFVTTHQALTIYKSKILPYFDYGDIFYINTYGRTRTKLQRLQNRGLKLCLGHNARYDTDLLHYEAKVPKLEPRRACHITNFVYHRAHDAKYTRVIDRQLRRFNAPIMTEIKANNSTFSRSVLYQGAIHWNSLPINERNIRMYNSFKRAQKSKLINW